MKSIRNVVLGLTVAAAALAVGPAQAGYGWHGHHHHHHHPVITGVTGVTVGTIVGGVAVQPVRPAKVYITTPVRPIYGFHPVFHGPKPWTPGWYHACSHRYRSFDPHSGTYVGYDGRRHFCHLH